MLKQLCYTNPKMMESTYNLVQSCYGNIAMRIRRKSPRPLATVPMISLLSLRRRISE